MFSSNLNNEYTILEFRLNKKIKLNLVNLNFNAIVSNAVNIKRKNTVIT